ncbi:hypothetical protein ACJQWK_04941 [Exserohilum turcicum]
MDVLLAFIMHRVSCIMPQHGHYYLHDAVARSAAFQKAGGRQDVAPAGGLRIATSVPQWAQGHHQQTRPNHDARLLCHAHAHAHAQRPPPPPPAAYSNTRNETLSPPRPACPRARALPPPDALLLLPPLLLHPSPTPTPTASPRPQQPPPRA